MIESFIVNKINLVPRDLFQPEGHDSSTIPICLTQVNVENPESLSVNRHSLCFCVLYLKRFFILNILPWTDHCPGCVNNHRLKLHGLLSLFFKLKFSILMKLKLICSLITLTLTKLIRMYIYIVTWKTCFWQLI